MLDRHRLQMKHHIRACAASESRPRRLGKNWIWPAKYMLSFLDKFSLQQKQCLPRKHCWFKRTQKTTQSLRNGILIGDNYTLGIHCLCADKIVKLFKRWSFKPSGKRHLTWLADLQVFASCIGLCTFHNIYSRCSMKYWNWEISELFRNFMHGIAVQRETKICLESVWFCLVRYYLFWWTIKYLGAWARLLRSQLQHYMFIKIK